MGRRGVKAELTEGEMCELDFEKVGKLYVQYDEDLIVWTRVLGNGNAPMGGQYYHVAPLAECA